MDEEMREGIEKRRRHVDQGPRAREADPTTPARGITSLRAARNLVRKCQFQALGRLVVVAAGFGLALTGWMLVMTVLLIFIGLPMSFFGLAVMQTQER